MAPVRRIWSMSGSANRKPTSSDAATGAAGVGVAMLLDAEAAERQDIPWRSLGKQHELRPHDWQDVAVLIGIQARRSMC